MNRQKARQILDFQQIRAVPLAAVLERYGILSDLKRIGTQHFGTCPIHQGTNKKQFVVDVNKNVWRCFGNCDRGGSTIELVSALEGIDARAAAERIATWFAIGSTKTGVQHRTAKRSNAMSGNRPTHKVYAAENVPEGSDEKAWLTRIGAAWPHKSGKGMNIQLQALPMNGRLVLFEYDDDDAKEDEDKKAKYKKK